jgi:hypothetical protein
MIRATKIVITFFVLLFASCVVRSQEIVTVDLSVNNGPATNRASGFLHGMNSTTPSPTLVNPLKPKFFRGDVDFTQDSGTYGRISSLSATPIWVLGDSWISAGNARTVSSSTMSAWNTLVANTVRNAIAKGQTFQWDIWNEPDLTEYWTGTEADYLAMWQNAVNTIRGIDPNQIIVGPSTCCSAWSAWPTDLMVFAKANNVLPNIVTLHEFSGSAGLATDMAAAKSFLAANDPSVTLVEATEMVDQGTTYLPGGNMKYIAAVERSQIQGAMHACWNNDCWDNSLDGLIGTDGATIHAVWYAYQAYASITGNIVGITPGASVDGVAGQDGVAHQAYSVFGRQSGTGDVVITYNNISSASYLNNGGSVHVTAFTLANDNGGGSTGPVQIFSADVPVNSNSISVTIPSMGTDDVAIVQLTPGASGASRPNPVTLLGPVVH